MNPFLSCYWHTQKNYISKISSTMWHKCCEKRVKNKEKNLLFQQTKLLMSWKRTTKYLHIYCRVQSSVWRLPNFWPPPPLYPASVSSRAVRGWGVNISEDAGHWIGLLHVQYNPTTKRTIQLFDFQSILMAPDSPIMEIWHVVQHSLTLC